MAKYAPGDRVLVRDDLVEGKFYDTDDRYDKDVFTNDMRPWKGRIVTIRSIDGGKYHLKEDNRFWWTDEMFAGLAEEYVPPDVSDLI